jgi:hypothetical protein
MTAAPPRPSAAIACSVVSIRPIASNTKSRPSGTVSRTWATGSPALASTASVAPSRRATPSLSGLTSTATMRPAFASRAPWMTERPTPPQPITATVAPSGTCAVFCTEPTPVATAHPTTATTSSGASSRMRIAPERGTTTRSANDDTPR